MQIMVDIETMATSRKASIMSIGAVTFDEKTPPTREGFYCTIKLGDVGNEHREINPDTVMWWLSQEKEAQSALIDEKHRTSFYNAIRRLGAFIEGHLKKDSIWANGASFDLGILRHAFEQENLDLPWRYNQECCMRAFRRTEKYNIFDAKWKEFKEANKNCHNALDDAYCQALYVYEIIKNAQSTPR